MSALANLNDGSANPPRLSCALNLGSLIDLPPHSIGPTGSLADRLEAVASAGFDGVQFFNPGEGNAAACERAGLMMTGVGRINQPNEADAIVRTAVDQGHVALTLHVGWGMESDDDAARLIEAVFDAHERHGLPLLPEIHRATIFQDIQRTVAMTDRYPDLRFNGDFSNWYTGQEMVYGGFENKLAFIEPVTDRVRFLHGRIGNPGCMQVDVGDGDAASHEPYVEHFRAMWTASCAGFLRSASPGDVLVFAPELLAPGIFFARTFPDAAGRPVEEGDRWVAAQTLCRIAQECFAAAHKSNACSSRGGN